MGNAKSRLHEEIFKEETEDKDSGGEKDKPEAEVEEKAGGCDSQNSAEMPAQSQEDKPQKKEENTEKKEDNAYSSSSSSDEEDGCSKVVVEEEISLALKPTLEKQDSKHQYEWEQRIIDETLIPNRAIYKAAIVGLDSALKAWSPPDFIPENQAIQDILEGFEGDVSGLAERGIAVGCGVRCSVPAKLDQDTGALYGNDGHRGGTSVFKTKENMIIIVFKKDPANAHRLGIRTATFMRRYDR